MPKTARRTRPPHRLRIAALVAGLILLVGLAVTFTIAAVQIQAAAAAYLSGQSAWSRAQMASVHYLENYLDEGEPEALETARRWLVVPLADLEARQAMEAVPLDYATARAGLALGQNHPDDIGRM